MKKFNFIISQIAYYFFLAAVFLVISVYFLQTTKESIQVGYNFIPFVGFLAILVIGLFKTRNMIRNGKYLIEEIKTEYKKEKAKSLVLYILMIFFFIVGLAIPIFGIPIAILCLIFGIKADHQYRVSKEKFDRANSQPLRREGSEKWP